MAYAPTTPPSATPATKSTPVTVTLVYEEWCTLVAGLFLAEVFASKAITDLEFYKNCSDKLYAQVYGANNVTPY